MKRFASFCILVVAALSLMAARTPQKGYKLTLIIDGGHDSVMYFGTYFVGKTYSIDTAHVNRKGQFVFEKKNYDLRPGLYFFTNQQGRYVEVVMYNEDFNITFHTAESDWTGNMKVKGSPQNDLFFTYQRINRSFYNLFNDAKQRMDPQGEEYKAFYREQVRLMDSITLDVIEKHPESLLGIMLNARRTPSVPTVDANGDSLTFGQQLHHYLLHYFDYVALDNDAILRTPESIFQKKLTDYLDRNLRNAHPDSIIYYVDAMIARAEPAKEVYQYLVHTITEKYLQSKVMSYDAVYVHMVHTYYTSGKAFWASPATIESETRRADKWAKLLVGKQAPELVLRDREKRFHSMYSIPSKYTLLVFWSPSCGHCKVEIPQLFAKFKEYRDKCDITAFTILSEPDEKTREKWYDFIAKHNLNDPHWLNLDGGEANIDWHDVYDVETTPQIYLLDREKKILAKKLSASSFDIVIKELEPQLKSSEEADE
ncbi:MAG: DUF4369 domain-containing protein [Bacteroidales bacterium]|nr:DUF4369 domain-containing protein [Bacteroidales bacterium]